MQPDEVWGTRWRSCANPIAHRFMETACEKQSLVCLAADLRTIDELVNLVNEVGPYIAALKTHVDIVEDFSTENWLKLVEAAAENSLLLFEDRKFADIGGISQKQMAGVYDIRSWSDIVTAHRISGPDIIDGIAAGWADVQRIGGVLLLAQMSSQGNLLTSEYTEETIATGKASPHVLGYIGNGSSPIEVSALRELVGDGQMIWTPGVTIDSNAAIMGQRYGNPHDSIIAGADVIIVGSGIYRVKDRKSAAKAYADASWNALLERER